MGSILEQQPGFGIMVAPWIAGAEVIQEPMDQGYGRDCAFRDPAENQIRIIETKS